MGRYDSRQRRSKRCERRLYAASRPSRAAYWWDIELARARLWSRVQPVLALNRFGNGDAFGATVTTHRPKWTGSIDCPAAETTTSVSGTLTPSLWDQVASISQVWRGSGPT